ncbi:MAG TPA: hypothetical protein VG757_02265 [Devosia sp.]|nr:hypothetical protein [Devosia sp.]
MATSRSKQGIGEAAQRDIEVLLAHRHDNGGDHWAGKDGRWGVGAPFSTIDCGLMLAELRIARPHPLAEAIADLVLACRTEDGRIRPGPHLAVQPCHTANAARLLCRLGYADDPRLIPVFEHLITARHEDGGWRCSVLKFGAGPDTDASNPGVTLNVLDAMRFRKDMVSNRELAGAVDTLLAHWSSRRPLGPCRFGIGSRFMQVEYPMFRYNLFSWVHVLSFYPRARRHPAFKEALGVLRGKLQADQMIIEHQKPGLKSLEAFRPGLPSTLATARYAELLGNVRS